jgi:hypothetical protein
MRFVLAVLGAKLDARSQSGGPMGRNSFTFFFTMTLAGVFLIVTGLIGYYPPAHMSLDAASWRRGEWTGEIIQSQVALGVAFLGLAAVIAVRVNRRLAREGGSETN